MESVHCSSVVEGLLCPCGTGSIVPLQWRVFCAPVGQSPLFLCSERSSVPLWDRVHCSSVMEGLLCSVERSTVPRQWRVLCHCGIKSLCSVEKVDCSPVVEFFCAPVGEGRLWSYGIRPLCPVGNGLCSLWERVYYALVGLFYTSNCLVPTWYLLLHCMPSTPQVQKVTGTFYTHTLLAPPMDCT